ncbi:AAA family ATPase [Candidatus Nomurabacteria bacterium]|nr:AAA family ATPase [Candidatus Nomurabacteria bacterium]
MNQKLALEILLADYSALITGPAGSGKTYLLNQFINLAKHEGKHVSVTATTGLAASHLGGTTIHSWSGIGIHDELPPKFHETISKGRREIIEKTDILIIDEISMLHDYRLDMVDEVCRLVRKKPDVPFGGIQVVMSGDFFQLPPVNRRDSRGGGFVVNSDAWRELDPVICYLNEQHRQDDGSLHGILEAMRAQDIRQSHAKALLSRTEMLPPEDQIYTELYTVNVDVDKQNKAKLSEIEGDEVAYEQTTTGAKNYVESLERSVMAPSVLKLKVGALVMAVKNSPEKRYFNGSLGKVVAFDPATDYPVVEFTNGREVTMEPDTWELRDGEKKRASITQIPLRLAWAITVHKSQGMTLDAALIDLRKAFVEGMGYVALSRVRSLDTLYLKGINRMALQMSDEAFAINQQLSDKAVGHKEKFIHLEKEAKKRDLNPTKKVKKSSNTWQQKIEKMRAEYPNAYRPWTNDQDSDLKLGFQNGESVASLSKKLGRHEGSIKMRLQKHFGEDVIA